jgi:hypothetical protein
VTVDPTGGQSADLRGSVDHRVTAEIESSFHLSKRRCADLL